MPNPHRRVIMDVDVSIPVSDEWTIRQEDRISFCRHIDPCLCRREIPEPSGRAM